MVFFSREAKALLFHQEKNHGLLYERGWGLVSPYL